LSQSKAQYAAQYALCRRKVAPVSITQTCIYYCIFIVYLAVLCRLIVSITLCAIFEGLPYMVVSSVLFSCHQGHSTKISKEDKQVRESWFFFVHDINLYLCMCATERQRCAPNRCSL